MAKRRGPNEGSIFKRSDGRWAAVVDLGWVNGRRRRKSLYARTRAEVAVKLRKALNDRDRGLPTVPERETVESFLRRWLEEGAQQTVRPTTYAGYETAVRLHVIPALGKKRLTRLTPADLNHLYIGLLNEKGLAPRYVRLIHAVLHRAFRQGERWGLIARNPADLLDAPRVPRKEAKYLRTPRSRPYSRPHEGSRTKRSTSWR